MTGHRTTEKPETKYALAGDLSIAYQVMGDGPIDLIMVPGLISHLEFFLELPNYEAFLRSLAAFSRVISFDKRGQGMSDGISGAPSLEARMDDLHAVMEAVGSKRAVLFGASEGCAMSALFAATHPELVQALILYGGFARFTKAPDYPHMGELSDYLRSVKHWGTGKSLKGFAPSLAEDDEFRTLWAKGERLCTTPAGYKRMLEINALIDVRSILPSVRVPTLVLHQRFDKLVPVANGRYFADHIPGARYIETPGQDHALPLLQTQHLQDIARAVEEFLTGEHHEPVRSERVLATVLFTDIVASSEHLARLGDRKWRDVLSQHDRVSETEVERHRGVKIKSTGDGLLATFDGPGRAVSCARAIREGVRGLDLEIRAGLHVGEVEVRKGDVSGIAVHIAARVLELAKGNEIFVTRTITDLVAGSNLSFDARGEQELKGIPGTWPIFALCE